MRRFLVALLLVLFVPAAADAAPRWSDGPLTNDIVNANCTSVVFPPTYYEHEIGAYMGQYVDDGSPVVGEVFDLHLVVATLGNNCSGTRPGIEIALPPGVSPATGSDSPGIRCFIRADSSQNFEQVTPAQGCPTVLRTGLTNHAGISSWFSLNPEPGSPAAPAWFLPQGAQIEIQVPVVADRVMNGIGDTNGCVCAVASITTSNGVSQPDPSFTWAHSAPQTGPYINLFVFPRKSDDGGGGNPGGGDPGGGDPGGGNPGGGDPGGGDPGGGTPGTTQPKLSLPKKLLLRKNRASVKVLGLTKGDRVSLLAKLRGTVVARGAGRATGGSLKVKLKRLKSQRALRTIRRGGRAMVVAKVRRPGKSTLTLKAFAKVR